MQTRVSVLSILAGLALTAAPARAQTTSEIAAAEVDTARLACFHPRPRARCRSFATTEVSLARRVGAFEGDDVFQIAWDFGLMVNRSPSTAIGAALHGVADYETQRIGMKLRYRRWLSPTASLDISPGLLLFGDHDSARLEPRFGFTGHVGVSAMDLVGLFAQVDVVERYERREPRVFVGMRLGSGAGLVGSLLAPIAWLYLDPPRELPSAATERSIP